MKGEGVDDIYVLSMPSFMYEVSCTPFFGHINIRADLAFSQLETAGQN